MKVSSKLKHAISVLLLAVTLGVAAAPTPATAAELTPAQYEFIAWTEAQGWTPQDWENFFNWARFMDLIAGVERCDRGSIEAFVGLLWGPNSARMNAIINRESRFNCNARNARSTASGLTQQLDIHAWRYARRGWDYHAGDRYHPVKNIEIAYELYQESGFAPWNF